MPKPEGQERSRRASVTVNFTHVIGGSMVRAFIGTGSDDPRIFGTLCESNQATASITLFCAARQYGGESGVLVTILHPSALSTNFSATVTLDQVNARRFDPPVLYTGA